MDFGAFLMPNHPPYRDYAEGHWACLVRANTTRMSPIRT